MPRETDLVPWVCTLSWRSRCHDDTIVDFNIGLFSLVGQQMFSLHLLSFSGDMMDRNHFDTVSERIPQSIHDDHGIISAPWKLIHISRM